jgi:hypothetical protein
MRNNSPKVIPYFGTTTILKSTLTDSIHTFLALTRLIQFRRIWTSINTNRISAISSDNFLKKPVSPSVVVVDEVSLKFEIPETTGNVALRFLEIIDWILVNEEVDFIWHSNISTYLNLDLMQSFLNSNSSKLYYAGVVGDYLDFSFVSGASVCLGRDTAELIILNRNQWDYSLPWDVALGKLLDSLSVKPALIARIDLTDTGDVYLLSDEQLRMTINFRCKSGSWRRRDYKIMSLLEARFSTLD